MSLDRLWSLIQQSSVRGARSTALAPFLWALTLILAGFVIGPRLGLPNWGLILLAVALVVLLGNFLAFAWYFAFKNPDALRSERFILTKRAMRQKNFRGANLVGFVRALSDDGSSKGDSIDAPTSPAKLLDQVLSVPQSSMGEKS